MAYSNIIKNNAVTGENVGIGGTKPIFGGNHEMIDSYFMLSLGGMAMLFNPCRS